jgi:glutaredoxin
MLTVLKSLPFSAMNLPVLVCVFFLSAGTCLAETLFRWVDSNGTVHYSNQPPPPSVKKVEEIKLRTSVIEGSSSYALQQAVKNFPVTLYATACGLGCYKARELLNKRGVPYNEKNPNQQPESADELKKIAGELLVPTLTVGDSHTLKGFEENAWNNALDAAGYPKTATPDSATGNAPTIPVANQSAPPSAPVTPPASGGNY